MNAAHNTILLSILLCTNIYPLSLDSNWGEMQQMYKQLKRIENEAIASSNLTFVHPEWQRIRTTIGEILLGNPQPNLLNNNDLIATMVRNYVSIPAQGYLDTVSLDIKRLLARYQETSFSNLPFSCQKYQCTANTLGQLYYLARIIEHYKANPQVIVEFGGGYGNLARASKMVLPDVTYIIIDLPEFLAIQYLYLRTTLSHVSIIAHITQPDFFEKGQIHLIPVTSLLSFKMPHIDVFVSAFGLSEAPLDVQNLLLEKNFLDASLCYIIGQENNAMYPNHSTLVNGIKKVRTSALHQPFYIENCYESFANYNN